MALSPAEKQREYRKRLKEKRDRKEEKRKVPYDLTDDVCTRPFNEFLTFDDWIEVHTLLEWAGIDPHGIPSFDNDSDPGYRPDLDVGVPNRGSIGRAERMIGCLLDAASQLAIYVNDYKKQEVERAIAELESRDLNDPSAKKQALAEIVRLTKILDRLSKKCHRPLPEWSVRGD